MNERINEGDVFEEEYDLLKQDDTTIPDNQVTTPVEGQQSNQAQNNDQPINSPTKESNEDTFISELLKSRGIEDASKIKFENENGEIEELDWASLTTEDKLNILNSSVEDAEDSLDASEIELINAIRDSKLSPSEYIEQLQRSSVETYISNMQNQQQNYSIDQYSDEELYVMDLISRSEEITEEEALEMLERAKSNEALFKKQMSAVRNEYKKAEEESLQYAKLKQEQEAQDQFNQFAEKIEDSILNFKTFAGGDVSMSEDDMHNLYDFITGFDNAGNNWFNKALSDPDAVVQMAWFYLNGEQFISDIDNYIKQVLVQKHKEGYEQGLKDAKKDTTSTVYIPKEKPNVNQRQEVFELEDDF